jgi:CRISPR-associated protein Cas1
MGWRTIYIQEATKLSLNLDNLEVLYSNHKYYIALEEIDNIVIEDYKTVLTARLISKLCEEGINIIFTDMKKTPVGAIHSLNGNSRTAKYTKLQLNLDKEKRIILWQKIIIVKISSQAINLDKFGKESDLLYKYISEVLPGDISNKEGIAARVYFKQLFGPEFVRFEDDIVNYSLNYVYQLVRSKIAQNIIAKGFHPSFGIFHKSEYNYFNLADDLIEPYRPLCDYFIYDILKKYEYDFLTPNYKEQLMEVFYFKVKINGKKVKLLDSIGLYMNHIFDIYEKGVDFTIYPELIDE